MQCRIPPKASSLFSVISPLITCRPLSGTKILNPKTLHSKDLFQQIGTHIKTARTAALDPLHLPAEQPWINDYLRQIRLDINWADRRGRTLLHVACGYDNVDLALYLLQNGADINRRDNEGRTPLDFAKNDLIQILTTYSPEL
jgi:hypothetical protein